MLDIIPGIKKIMLHTKLWDFFIISNVIIISYDNYARWKFNGERGYYMGIFPKNLQIKYPEEKKEYVKAQK